MRNPAGGQDKGRFASNGSEAVGLRWQHTPEPTWKRWSAYVLAMALIAGVAFVFTAIAPQTASAAGAAFDCSGSTVYTITSSGNVYAVNTSTGVSTLFSTDTVSTPNGLGIALDGKSAFAVNPSSSATVVPAPGSPGQPIHRYASATGAWTTGPLASSTNLIIAGAVNPANGLYYYVNYHDKPNVGARQGLYAYNPSTNTNIGQVASIPSALDATDGNGDLAFSRSGALYLLDDGALYVVASVPSVSGSATLQVTTLVSSVDPAADGIAFGGDGLLYLTLGGSPNLLQVDPTTGATIKTVTVTGPAMSDASVVADEASCNFPASLTVAKTYPSGRVVSTDQVQLSASGNGIPATDTATTTGNTSGLQTAVAGPVLVHPGATYTVTETPSSGSSYASSYTCKDSDSGSTVVGPISGTSGSVTIPPLPPTGEDIVCTFTNSPSPDLSITKTDNVTTYVGGQTNTYQIVVANKGSTAATNPLFTDPVIAGLTVASVSCAVTSGGAACSTPANTTVAKMQGTGIPIQSLPANSSVTFTVTGTVGAGTTGALTNTATITPAAGTTNAGTACAAAGSTFTSATGACTASDTDTRVLTPPVCTSGTVYGLDDSTANQLVAINAATGVETFIGAFPVTSDNLNGLGVTKNGTDVYAAIKAGGTVGSLITVYRYNLATGVTSSYSGGSLAITGPSNSSMPSGAVDPSNDIYYYATQLGSDNHTLQIYGFDTNTDTPIGLIGTFATGHTISNGDFAFDADGNLYVLVSTGANAYLERLNAAGLPAVAGNIAMTGTTIMSFPSSGNWNGISFDPSGRLWLVDHGKIASVDPNSGTVGASVTLSGPMAQASDLAGCGYPGELTLQKNVVGRLASGDQFNLAITGNGIAAGNTGQTSGSSTGQQTSDTATAGPVIGVAGASYTIAETVAGTTNLGNYSSTWSCTDATGAVVKNGTGVTGTFTFPNPSGANGADWLCTFTNTPLGTMVVTKALAGIGRAGSGDQFTVAIHSGTVGGTVVNSPATSTSVGTGATVNAGSGTTGATTVTPGTQYWVTEAASGMPSLAQYTATLTCLDANGVQSTLPTNLSFDPNVGVSITPQPGSAISCTITNTPVSPVMTVTKALDGVRVANTDQFTVAIHSGTVAGTVVNSTANSKSTGTGAVVDPGTGTTGATTLVAGTQYWVTETASGTTNLAQYTATLTCTDANGVQPAGLPSAQALNPTTGIAITPVTGSNISCTITNTQTTPTMTVKKALGGVRVADTDQFTVAIHSATIGGAVVNSAANADSKGIGATVNVGTGTTGSTPLIASTAYVISEASLGTTNPAQYSATMACVDANGVQPGLLPAGLAFDPTMGVTLTPAAGSNITCVITNTPIAPTMTVTKALAGPRVADSDQFIAAIHAASIGGTVVNSTAASTSSGVGSTVDAGTGTTGATAVTAGTPYVVSEAKSGTTNLAQYTATLTCTDANGIQTSLPSGQALNPLVGITVTPQAGANLSCTITNTPVPPTMTVKKLLPDGRVASGDEFTVAVHSGTVGGVVVNSTTNSTTGGTGSTVTAGSGTTGTTPLTAGAGYVVTEAASGTSDLTQYAATISCVDANGVQTPPLPSGLAFDPNVGVSISPVAGSSISCSIVNTPSLASLVVSKSVSPPDKSVVTPGTVLTYTFTVTNNGPPSVSAVAVSDPRLIGVVCPPATLAAGQSEVCLSAAPYVITDADVVAGVVLNTAVATATGADGLSITSNQSSANVPTGMTEPIHPTAIITDLGRPDASPAGTWSLARLLGLLLVAFGVTLGLTIGSGPRRTRRNLKR